MPLASTGTVKTLTLLVEFADLPNRISRDAIHSMIYGDGSAGGGFYNDGNGSNGFPFESLAAYYRRSSNGKLNFTGTTVGWYRLSGTRAYYASFPQVTDAVQAMVVEALNYYRSAAGGSLKFAEFDTDGDGYLDAINVIHSGPSTRPSMLDGFMDTFDTASYIVDGKKLGPYVFNDGDTNPSYSTPGWFDVRTLVHETGHLLGLPDYYDYQPFADDGIVGGISHDIMGSGAEGDHNVFSKWLLGWVDPVVISSGVTAYTLNAASGPSDSNTAFAIFPSLSGNRFSQFYMVENAQRTGNRSPTNNADFPSGVSDGLLIWHIDATLNSQGTNTLYNNSQGSRKLIRMMQADGQDDIETLGTLGALGIIYPVDAVDFWQAGDVFNANTFPNSNSYEGRVSGVVVRDISAAGPVMTATMGVESPTRPAPVMLGPTSATGLVNSLFRFPIRALGGPTLFSSGPLPDGLRIEPIAGAIVAIPRTPGTYVVPLTATNEASSASLNVTLQILSQAPPPELAPNYNTFGLLQAACTLNSMCQFALTATNAPTRFRIFDSLPPGLRMDPETGVISGRPTLAGWFSVYFNAYNNSGRGSGSLSINVAAISPTRPTLSITKAHDGNFTQGQNKAVYTVRVSNAAGAGSTSGAATVTETAPSGLTLVSMAGTGWTCPAGAPTCTRADPLAAGASYPLIAVTVNVAVDAPPWATNSVTVSGGGLATATATDLTTITAAAPIGPQISSGGLVNAATSQSGGIAPNEFISLKGTGLGPATGVVSSMTTQLAGTSVSIGGTPAYLTYAQDGQINVLVPFNVSGLQNTTVQVQYNGMAGNSVTAPVVPSSPGIFTQQYGPGQVWMVNQDGTFNSSSNPAARNSYVTFWVTGQGAVNTPLPDGTQPSGPPYPTPILPVSVSLGGVAVPTANIAFDGLVYSGEMQINLLIPANAPTGSTLPLVVTIGAASSRSDATIAIR
jgi:uncharacterized protein (TIGR03437 family)